MAKSRRARSTSRDSRKPHKRRACEPTRLLASIERHGSLLTFRRMLGRRDRRTVENVAALAALLAAVAEEELASRPAGNVVPLVPRPRPRPASVPWPPAAA